MWPFKTGVLAIFKRLPTAFKRSHCHVRTGPTAPSSQERCVCMCMRSIEGRVFTCINSGTRFKTMFVFGLPKSRCPWTKHQINTFSLKNNVMEMDLKPTAGYRNQTLGTGLPSFSLGGTLRMTEGCLRHPQSTWSLLSLHFTGLHPLTGQPGNGSGSFIFQSL